MNGKIYKITNAINGHSYIGQTINDIEARFNQHKSGACKAKINHSKLQKAMIEYGAENFEITLIEENINTMAELSAKETYYIVKYNTKDEYNSNYGGVPRTKRSRGSLSKLMEDNESLVLSDLLEFENMNLTKKELDLMFLFFFKLKGKIKATISFNCIKELFDSKNLFPGQIVDLTNSLKDKVENYHLFKVLEINETSQFIEIELTVEAQTLTNPSNTEKYIHFEYSDFRELDDRYSKLFYIFLLRNKREFTVGKEEFICKLDIPRSYRASSSALNDKVLKNVVNNVSEFFGVLKVEKKKTGREITEYKFITRKKGA